MLFKILHGDASRISTDITPYHEGYCYVTHDGYFYVDMNNERVKLNSHNAETLTGMSLEEIQKSISYNDLKDKPNIPSKTSELTNDSGYITGYTETDPTVPSWAKSPTKPSYTASEVGADPSGSASSALQEAKTYTNNAVAQKSQVQILRWEETD